MKPKIVKPTYPPVDKLKAVILERKMVMGLTYDQIAHELGYTAPWFRKLMTTVHTDDWNPDMRRKVCSMLHINVKQTIEDLFDLE